MSDSSELLGALRTLVRRFATDRLALATDRLEHCVELPYPLMRELADDLGLAAFAEAAVTDDPAGPRGTGLGAIALLPTVMHELSRVNPGFALSFGASVGLCGQTLLTLGTPEQRARWARPVLALEQIGAWALTEPGSGSDAFGMRTVAGHSADGYVLDGEKTFITNAPHADVFVVYARVPVSGREDRIHGFIVERDTPGVSVSKPFAKMGMWSSPTGSISLDGVRVGRDHLLGGHEESSGRRGVIRSLLGERLAICAMALGIIERSLEIALAYAKDREQFGQPIASFQAIQLRLARMYAAQEAVRALLDGALARAAAAEPDAAYFCAAKYTATTHATQVALEAVQVLGGNGYMREYVVERLARDAKLLEIGGGTSDIQLLTVARELIGRG